MLPKGFAADLGVVGENRARANSLRGLDEAVRRSGLHPETLKRLLRGGVITGFKAAHGFPFELLSDKDETVCELFGVMKLKNMYGKQVRGIERSTFVFDKDGKLVKSWRGLKAPGHAAEVLGFVQTL